MQPDSRTGATVFSAVRPVFRAVATTIVPAATSLDEQGWVRLEELAAEALRDRQETEIRQLRLFLRLIEWLPVLRYGRRFTSLDPPRRERFLCYLQDHRIPLVRTGFWGLRTLALLGFYGRPDAAQAIGYTPDLRGWEALR